MKASVWNILSVAFLVGTVFLIVIFGLIFLMPNQVLPTSMRPISVPQALILPSATETVFQFPPTWTKSPKPVTPSDTQIPPTATTGIINSATPDVVGTGTAGYIIPSKSSTASASPTKTQTKTVTFSSSKAVIVNGTRWTFTKTKKPTKTKTPAPSITPGGPSAFNAVNDYAIVAPNPASILINVVANDENLTGTALHIVSIFGGPSHGYVDVISSTTVKYWAKAGYVGSDTFQYKMTNVGGLTDIATVVIDVIDGSNMKPTDITLDVSSINEGKAAGTYIGVFSTTDPAPPATSGPFYYVLVDGVGSTNNRAFTLTTDGKLYSASIFDYEIKTSYSIRVRSTDPGGLYYEKVFLILVNDTYDEYPVINTGETATGVVGNPFTFTIKASDDDSTDVLTFTAIPDPTSSFPPGLGFVDNGNKTATISGTPTAPGVYTLNIRVVDLGGLFDDQTLKITINDPTATPTATTAP